MIASPQRHVIVYPLELNARSINHRAHFGACEAVAQGEVFKRMEPAPCNTCLLADGRLSKQGGVGKLNLLGYDPLYFTRMEYGMLGATQCPTNVFYKDYGYHL